MTGLQLLSRQASRIHDASLIREKETADFSASESELVDAVDTLGRAFHILDREMQKNPAALMQVDTTSMPHLVSSLSAVMTQLRSPRQIGLNYWR